MTTVHYNSMSCEELKVTVERLEAEYRELDWGTEEARIFRKKLEEASRELGLRKAAVRSKLPGENPAIYIPGVQLASHITVSAAKLEVGDYAKFRPNPGSNRAYYVEVVAVEDALGERRVTWRKTNAPDSEPFTSVYDLDDTVNVSRLTLLHEG